MKLHANMTTAKTIVKTEETTQPQEIEGEVAGETGSKSQAKVNVEEEEISTPRGNDILSGRGNGVQTHPGNMHFRKIIQANKETYIMADASEKKRIILSLAKELKSYGRFLKQNSREFWVKIDFDEVKKKVGQALRENATMIRKQMKEDKANMKLHANMTTAKTIVKTEETTQPQEIEGEVAGETGSKSQAKVNVEEEEISTPRGNDILSGRGNGVQTHPGNMHFRKIIQANKETYIMADASEKKRIILSLAKELKSYGRFLKQNSREFWVKIDFDEVKKKVGQALRENATMIRKQMKENKTIRVSAVTSDGPPPAPVPVPVQAPLPMPASNQSFSAYEMLPRDIGMMNHHPQMMASTVNLLRVHMHKIEEKQDAIKRKQRELEDEQILLLRCYYQITSQFQVLPSSPSHHRNINMTDSDSDYSYGRSNKKRKF